MAIFVSESTEFSLFIFACEELQPIGLPSPMALIHLLEHAGCWGQLTALGWAVDMRNENIFIFGQYFFIPAATALSPWAGVHHMHSYPRILHT